jgi:hypothetical protein
VEARWSRRARWAERGRAGGGGGGVAGWARPSTWAWTRARSAAGPGTSTRRRAVARPSRTRQMGKQLCDVLFLMCIRSHAGPAKTHGSTRRPPEGLQGSRCGAPLESLSAQIRRAGGPQSQDRRCNNGDDSGMGAPRRRRRCGALLYRTHNSHRRSRGPCGRASGTDKPDVDPRASAACQPVAARRVLSVAKRPTSCPKISRA